MEGLDITIHELTPCLTLVQISMVCDDQKRDVTLQFLIQQDASRVASYLKRWIKLLGSTSP